MLIECPVCESRETSDFFELKNMPVLIGTLWQSASEAKATATGDIVLRYCAKCGFIWNRVFDPSRMTYSETYENSLHFSEVFQRYSTELVDRLIETYDLRGKHVIDIGCGKGDFIAMLCERGGNSGTGFDPSYEGDRISSDAADRITFIQDLYSEKYADLKADMVSSRYVFEHVERPVDFLNSIVRSLGDSADALIYFEVPNARLILDRLSVWDIIYEHCSYFGIESLAASFQRAGFGVLNIDETYDRQFVAIEARRGAADAKSEWGNLAELTAAVDAFRDRFATRIADWEERLTAMRRDGKTVVAWGAGAKAVGFLNMLELDAEQLPYVVDINPNKQGTYLGGTGQEVVSPDRLVEVAPDAVILMNPIYQKEIEEQVRKMGLETEFLAA